MFGIWSEGKRKKWLNEDEIENLKNENNDEMMRILEFKEDLR